MSNPLDTSKIIFKATTADGRALKDDDMMFTDDQINPLLLCSRVVFEKRQMILIFLLRNYILNRYVLYVKKSGCGRDFGDTSIFTIFDE